MAESIAAPWQKAPWLKDPWQQLLDAQARYAHAIAIEAVPGLGAEAMLKDYVALRLCEHASRRSGALACGQCASCHWLASGQHPDLRIVRPAAFEAANALSEPTVDEEASETKGSDRKLSHEIRIDQIRPLAGFLQIGSHRAGARIVWLEPAQWLNRSAANALLKMLEEPGEGALWILLTDRLSSLLPTIRSRCICLKVRPPVAKDAEVFLKALIEAQPGSSAQAPAPTSNMLSLALGLSGNAPWSAQQRILDPVLRAQGSWLHTLAEMPDTWFSTLARQWAEHQPEQWFELLERWAIDLLQAVYQLEPLYFKAFAEAAARRAKGIDPNRCFKLIEQLYAMKASLRHPLNPRLHAESALLLYANFSNINREKEAT